MSDKPAWASECSSACRKRRVGGPLSHLDYIRNVNECPLHRQRRSFPRRRGPSRSFQGAAAKRRRTRTPSLGRAPSFEGRAPQNSARLCATAARGHLRATAERTPKLRRLGAVDVGQQSVRATSDRRAGPRRVAATHLSRASPSGTRSRSGDAPLPRPAPWRAA
jgi:hypothetical protein